MSNRFELGKVFSRSPAVLSTAILLIAGFVAAYFARKRKKAVTNIVIEIEDEHESSLVERMITGYHEYRDVPYILPAVPDHLILPSQYLDEIKSLPEDQLSFKKEMYMRVAGKYSSLGLGSPAFYESIRKDLTRNTGSVLEELQKEAEFAIPYKLGPCNEWTELPMYATAVRIIAALSGRVFVGYPLCRNEEWIEATMNFTIASFAASVPILKYPAWFRPFVAPFIPQVKTTKKYRRTAYRLLKPLINERLTTMREDSKTTMPNDVLQYLIRNTGVENLHSDADIAGLAMQQLILSIVAIHTTSMQFTHMIFDLCAHPEVVEALLEELKSVLESEGCLLIKQNLTKLKKMDSFMKEVQRVNPETSIALQRYLNTHITLSSGLEIPKGSSIAFNSVGPNMDPAIWSNPETFDPFRFSRLREQTGNQSKYQFVTTNENSINFGHGLHACPGRFFVSNQLKVAFTFFLLNYECRFKEGQGRPKNLFVGVKIRPDQTVGVLFKRREGAQLGFVLANE